MNMNQLCLRRLNAGIILSEAKKELIYLRGFQAESGVLFSLVQIRNKIALLSIPIDELKELGEDETSIELSSYFNNALYSDLRFKFENNVDMFCNKQLLSFFSKYFRKHLSDPDVFVVKINDVSFATFQLLIQ